METIRPLADISMDEIYTAWEEAFRDYERTWTRAEMEQTICRRGFVRELSFSAFANDRLVSFTLNGIGLWNGVRTAYDTGTGTIPAYRGKGLASQIFQASLPLLREEGVSLYLLEVLQHNSTAIEIYRRAGFRISRELSYFIQETDKVSSARTSMPQVSICRIDIKAIAEPELYWDFRPSWQNSLESISRRAEDFITFGAYYGEVLAGYSVMDPSTGDISQIAVAAEFRRKGIGTALLQEMVRHNRHPQIKLINAEAGYEPMSAFLESVNIPICGKQFEMMLDL